MPSSHLSSIPALNRRPRPSEDGFGVLEVVVVLIIVAILMAIAISSFRGTKRTNHFRAAQAAAAQYAEGVESYMADNGQRPPAIGSADWPTARPQRYAGPLDPMLTNKHYLRSAPEAVTDGLVDLVVTGESASARSQAWITYSTSGTNYTLLVTGRARPGESALQCAVTNAVAPPAGVKRC